MWALGTCVLTSYCNCSSDTSDLNGYKHGPFPESPAAPTLVQGPAECPGAVERSDPRYAHVAIIYTRPHKSPATYMASSHRQGNGGPENANKQMGLALASSEDYFQEHALSVIHPA